MCDLRPRRVCGNRGIRSRFSRYNGKRHHEKDFEPSNTEIEAYYTSNPSEMKEEGIWSVALAADAEVERVLRELAEAVVALLDQLEPVHLEDVPEALARAKREGKAVLAHARLGSGEGELVPFSYIDHEARDREFHVHAFHAYPQERTLVKTQSIVELPE